uniref:Peptidoglycan binding-like domain-containing protein n=1 Tax=uncultured organism TaxID=155900 RepID=M1PWZ5_9ZZZZ|nr:conserved hypothetical protein, secreted [uncultured organism]
MKRILLFGFFLLPVVFGVQVVSAEVAPFYKSENYLGDAAKTIAYKLDQNLMHRLNRSLPVIKTSLVNIDNLKKSSTLGRYLGDQIGVEFANYGYKVNELGLRSGSILMKKGRGEFALTRDVEKVVRDNEVQAVILGTYCKGKRYVDVSVRIVSAIDQSIISSCNVRIRKTPSIEGMLKESRYDDSGMDESETNDAGTNKSKELAGGPYESGKVELDQQSIIDTRIVQKRLRKLDFYHGCIDGIWGPKTQKALENFKQAYHIPDPEEWNMQTQKKLFSLP